MHYIFVILFTSVAHCFDSQFYFKANYKDKWVVQTKTTKSCKLRAQFDIVRQEQSLELNSMKSFFEEARVMRILSNKQIVPLLGLTILKSKPCMVMPIMSHGNLQRFLQEKTKVSTGNNNKFRK